MYRFLSLVVLAAAFGSAVYGFISVFGSSHSYADSSAQQDHKTQDYKPPAGGLGIGDPASPEQIAGWDIDVRPDGLGLPEGSGSVEEGEKLYEVQCAYCHGAFGEGEGRWPVLAGGEGSLSATGEDRPLKTIGSYWPYVSTLWDYTRRAMPFTAPMSLSADETYAITAYVLHLNDLVDYDYVLSKSNFSDIKLPNEANFFPQSDNYYDDSRPDTSNTDCMSDCRNPTDIKVTSAIAGLTPVSHFKEGVDSPAATHSGEDPTEISAVAKSSEGGHTRHAPDSKEAQIEEGEGIYKSNCAACHQAGGEGLGSTFPALKGSEIVLGAIAAHIDIILNGKAGTAMTGYARLTDRELAAVITYQRNAWGNSAVVDQVTPEQVAAWR